METKLIPNKFGIKMFVVHIKFPRQPKLTYLSVNVAGRTLPFPWAAFPETSPPSASSS